MRDAYDDMTMQVRCRLLAAAHMFTTDEARMIGPTSEDQFVDDSEFLGSTVALREERPQKPYLNGDPEGGDVQGWYHHRKINH